MHPTAPHILPLYRARCFTDGRWDIDFIFLIAQYFVQYMEHQEKEVDDMLAANYSTIRNNLKAYCDRVLGGRIPGFL